MRKWLIICLIVLFFICLSTSYATEVTMKVDSKHIVGMGTGNTPFGDFCNVVYVVSEMDFQYPIIAQEYPISMEDYVKISRGQTIVLEQPYSDSDPWIVKSIK